MKGKHAGEVIVQITWTDSGHGVCTRYGTNTFTLQMKTLMSYHVDDQHISKEAV